MKLTEKYAPTSLTAKPWRLYEQCSSKIGEILDNKFHEPHVKVYEHVRHTPAEVFKHADDCDHQTWGDLSDDGGLHTEEVAILEALRTGETGRRLNIVGDVGVGKTTFIKHLTALHLATPDFGEIRPIFIDFSNFTASLVDPILDIQRKFVDTVWSALESYYSPDTLAEVDRVLFQKSHIFATHRSIANLYSESEKSSYFATAMADTLKTNSVVFTTERLNQICVDDPNSLLLIIDNIDHLPEQILSSLSKFLLQVQLDAKPMLVVCMRDHTFMSGFSSYREDKTVPAWKLRLKPPNLNKMLNRRINHFFPENIENSQVQKIFTGSGVLKIDQDISKVCRALLRSPFADQETYEFLCSYTNFNIRNLFVNLQWIVGFHGHSFYDREFFIQDKPSLKIGIDECIIALSLRENLMYFPQHSPIFNPYSSGHGANPLDRLVAVRMLQMLYKSIDWILFSELRSMLVGWGYNASSVDTQIRSMINKDLVWTSTGAPANFSEYQSQVRLSYRGQLYLRTIMKRTVYNYMMSFDVDAPSESHSIYRHHKSEFKKELETFASFKPFDTDALALRVLGLAELLFESEMAELRMLKTKNELKQFQLHVAPNSSSLTVIEGLVRFLQKTLEVGSDLRFMAPTTETIKQASRAKENYENSLSEVYLNRIVRRKDVDIT